jgi:hypothetical protein
MIEEKMVQKDEAPRYDPRRDLETIRDLMERARHFRHPPALAGAIAGLLGIAAARFTEQTLAHSSISDARVSLGIVWGGAFLGSLVAVVGLTFLAARRDGLLFWSPLARDVLHSLWPSLVTGAALSWALFRAGHLTLIPPLWMLCYGIAGVAAGSFSRWPVRALGCAFLFAGVLTLVFEPSPGLALGGSFGLLHLLYAALVARRAEA